MFLSSFLVYLIHNQRNTIIKKTPELILNEIKVRVFSESIISNYKVSQNDFTRRKQSFQSTILFMLNFLTKSLSIEIENFVSFIKNSIGNHNTKGVKFKDIIINKYQIPTELNYTNERLRDYVFKNGQPMKFYTRKEIDREIEIIKIKENPKALLNEPHVAKADALNWVNPHSVEHIETNNDAAITTEQCKPLNANDYPGYPALQQKINDHLTLMGLRSRYFHTSHDCSVLKDMTGIAYFDPYAASIRTKPSRGINQG